MIFASCVSVAAFASEGRRVVVISDNARYHHALLHKEWRADHESQFALDFLPPYSPQLNPIERVWKLLRRLCLHNQHFRSLEEVTAAVQPQFETWSQSNDALRKVCSIFG